MGKRHGRSKPLANATPKIVLDAFFPAVIRLGEIEIKPCKLGHLLALERINSPILGRFKDATWEDCARALYILSLPTPEAMRQARDPAVLDKGFLLFLDRVPGGEIAELAKKVAAQLNSAFATAVASKQDSQDNPLPAGVNPSQPQSA